ncbi:uncharacterized protein LOC141910153 [Tubulanus polymorphus]|uniref:uncharacterized protein LOC141910153 n=1 Tax=Tubulanus polymorphus TaxID=672921 RepID=UPI003DA6C74A
MSKMTESPISRSKKYSSESFSSLISECNQLMHNRWSKLKPDSPPEPHRPGLLPSRKESTTTNAHGDYRYNPAHGDYSPSATHTTSTGKYIYLAYEKETNNNELGTAELGTPSVVPGTPPSASTPLLEPDLLNRSTSF